MRIAPEGLAYSLGGAAVQAALATVLVLFGGWWWIPALMWLPVAIWIPTFFRDPPRPGPRGDHLVIAPADGVVVGVNPVDPEEYVEGRTVRIAIFMNVFNVHVNRSPVGGTVEYRRHREGRYFNAMREVAGRNNEMVSLGIRTERGKLLVRQIAGLIARRIIADPQPGQAVDQGERLGLIQFGSRVDTFLPAGCRPRVSAGNKTRAGQTVIGEWQ